MKNEVINVIEQKMSGILNNEQMKKLSEVLSYAFFDVDVVKKSEDTEDTTDYVDIFITAKRIEGCSERPLNYY